MRADRRVLGQLAAADPTCTPDCCYRSRATATAPARYGTTRARRLFLAPKTIRNRVSDMLDKLGVTTREEAIALGRAGGLGHATPHPDR